jgi:hypothetical protein
MRDTIKKVLRETYSNKTLSFFNVVVGNLVGNSRRHIADNIIRITPDGTADYFEFPMTDLWSGLSTRVSLMDFQKHINEWYGITDPRDGSEIWDMYRERMKKVIYPKGY